MLATLHAAIDAKDELASQRAVHSLKGVLVNFGAQRAIVQAERLATSLQDQGQAAQWRGHAQELGPALDEVYEALRELIATGVTD